MTNKKNLENELINNNSEKSNLDLLNASLYLIRSYKETYGCEPRVDFWKKITKTSYIIDYGLTEEEFIQNFDVMRNIKDLKSFPESTYVHCMYTDGCNQLKNMHYQQELENKIK